MTRLITALSDPEAWPHAIDHVEVIETHISWVLLAGDYAYKIKKPVVLPFLDFGTLAARHRHCRDELRLNRRFAPQVYLDVVPITGSSESPRVDGEGTPIEYAVKMRRFEQGALFNRLLEDGVLEPALIDRLAERIAVFHVQTPAITDAGFGTPNKVLQPVLDNFSEMLPHADSRRCAALQTLETWTRSAFARLEAFFAARHRDGYVRECHGDLHLRNVVLIDGQPVPFDCIEFSAELRCIDVISEAAFLVMDLLDRDRPDLGYRFLDRYLAETGDYPGITGLRFYLVYRALVRAKVHDLRSRQAADDPHESLRLRSAADHYVTLATDISQSATPALILMHGFSGAGKSRVAAALVEALGGIRVRSDIERKRLFGLGAGARTGSGVDAGIYSRRAGAQTYERLAELAGKILEAGYPVILDAAFLTRVQREPMYELANTLGNPVRIVDCTADATTLRERVAARAAQGGDASEATLEVLEHQMALHEPLSSTEQARTVLCDMCGSEATRVAACVVDVERSLSAG